MVLYVGLSIDFTLCEADNHLEIIKMVLRIWELENLTKIALMV